VAERTGGPYPRLVGAQVRSQVQYRTSFVMDLAGSTLFGIIDLVAVAVMFRVTPTLGTFTFRETFLMAGLSMAAFAVADLAVGNVGKLGFYVRTGQLDAMLIRPLSVLAQLAAVDFAPRRIGRVVLGAVTIVVAASAVHVPATPARLALLVVAPLAGGAIFGAVIVATAVVAFWWVESGEFASSFTNGGRDFTSYPMNVYSGVIRRLFAYLLGFAFVAYYPALALLGRPDPLGGPPWLGWLSPLVALAAAAAAALLWRMGIRRYRSAGS
jgi:ABC-2 type transport system permease protein